MKLELDSVFDEYIAWYECILLAEAVDANASLPVFTNPRISAHSKIPYDGFPSLFQVSSEED